MQGILNMNKKFNQFSFPIILFFGPKTWDFLDSFSSVNLNNFAKFLVKIPSKFQYEKEKKTIDENIKNQKRPL